MSAFVSRGCHQLGGEDGVVGGVVGGLTTTEIYSLAGVGVRSPRSRLWQASCGAHSWIADGCFLVSSRGESRDPGSQLSFPVAEGSTLMT